MMSCASILAYTDGDAASDHRIRIAAGLADRFDAALIGIAACAPRPPLNPDDLMGREIEAEMTAIATDLAEKERKFLAVASGPGRKVEWRASQRPPQ